MLPNVIQYEGRPLIHAGPGRAPGSHVYYDTGKGAALELFLGTVVRVGPDFALASVNGNAAISSIRVEHGSVDSRRSARLGEQILLGPLHLAPSGPRAVGAWSVIPNANGNGTPTGRLVGVVIHTSPDRMWGFVSDERGTHYFVHASKLANATRFVVGARVTFVPSKSDRGLVAFDVRNAG